MPEDSSQKRKPSANPYRTVSASERRARRLAREASKARVSSDEGAGFRASERKASAAASLPQDMINELLANPTKVVTEDDLRRDYSYVIADLRSMALLAAALVVFLIALAFVLPR